MFYVTKDDTNVVLFTTESEAVATRVRRKLAYSHPFITYWLLTENVREGYREILDGLAYHPV